MTAAHGAAADPLRVMIVDDEAPAREGLRLRLRQEPGVLVIGEYGDAPAALEALRADPPDLLFLDVEMPGLDGFALLERAGDLPLPVVFVTAHESYAVRAFAARALDYLLKPVEQPRLRDALDRARERLVGARREEVVDRVRNWLAALDGGAAPIPAARRPARIPVRRDGAIHLVNADDVDYIDAAGDGVILHVGSAEHRVNRTMGEISAQLDPDRFVRIHRSTIVNVDRVRELQPWFHGEYVVVLKDGRKLKLSRGQRPAVMKLLGLREE